MKKIFTLLLLSLFLFGACKMSGKEEPAVQPAPQNPAAFEDKSNSDFKLVSKRYDNDDMVSELYKEILAKDASLNELETAIGKLDGQRIDSVQPFYDYDNKNKSYYSSVQTHLQSITDSGLKQRMKSLIDNSMSDYKGTVSKHNGLIALLDSKDIDISNLHVVLKIVKTLPMAEKFQEDNLPSAKPMEKMLATYIRLIQQSDKLSKTK